ncbi:MAG TPA: isoleucine--tRNA ligase [Candidatus Limnocylindria bacterium]|nr:isoleucine--tRNA ligase [Candidatus Limnocylindria bacterium]
MSASPGRGPEIEKARFQRVGAKLDLAEVDHGVLDLWEREDSFKRLRKKNAGGPRFRFFDGPITANVEAMGVHHAWARTYKDVYQRYKAMRGYDQRYQNGFDCQGLWVEVQVERELNLNSKRDIEKYGIAKFSDACRARVDRSAAAITKHSIRMGQWMDWENSYFTYSDLNISHIWHVLKLCHERGWLYQGHRSMPWCARCGTALSQHEMIDSYREMTHLSVYVRFPIEGRKGESFLVWTTTPWTLAANVSLAVHPDLEYVRAKVGDEVLIVSRETYEAAKWENSRVLETLKGRALLGLRYRGPFDELPAGKEGIGGHRVIAWAAVSAAEGTGLVHIAPGCGAEDFALSKTEKLPVLVPIDENARYVRGYGWLEGKEARDVAQEIADDLKGRGLLFRAADYTHRYPECWRCHEEIVFRVDDEWFISMDELRPKLIAAAAKVNWIPPASGRRMENWLQNMGDWNISRKRYWGLPLPFYRCANGHFFVIGSEEELRERAKRGLEDLRELHRPWIDAVVVGCSDCGADSARVKEVGDCWLDAGIVPFSTLDWLHDREYWEKWFPADYIVEMVEQVRLWFYSQLFFAVVLTGEPPYRAVQTFMPMLAAPGEEFHKTGANMVNLYEACESVGADVIRWIVAREDLQEIMYFSWEPLQDLKRKLLILWNTYSFFVTYANLDGFDPAERQVPLPERPVIDRWLLSALARLVADSRAAYDAYDVRSAILKIEAFWEDLSTWYVRRNRARFWKARSRSDSLAAYQTLYEALTTLIGLVAPVMPFLAEEMYQGLVRHAGAPGAEGSVHHTAYPEEHRERVDDDLERRMRAARRVVELGRAARASAGVKTRMPLPRLIVVFDASDHDHGALDGRSELADIVKDELNVKALEVRDRAEGLVKETVKPDLKVLGPKLGKDLPRIRQALAEGRYERRDGSIVVEGLVLSPKEVLVSHEGAPGHAVGRDAGATVALETGLTPELELEGLARELAHHLNNMRKEAGLEISDRIALRYAGPIARAFDRHGSFIAEEALAETVSEGLRQRGHVWEGELNGVSGKLEIEKV